VFEKKPNRLLKVEASKSLTSAESRLARGSKARDLNDKVLATRQDFRAKQCFFAKYLIFIQRSRADLIAAR